MRVKFCQIAASDGWLFALDTDGFVWEKLIDSVNSKWVKRSSPEDEEEPLWVNPSSGVKL